MNVIDIHHKILHDDDIRGLSVAHMGDSEGTRGLSWIWLAAGVGTEGGDDQRQKERAHECR